MNDGGRAGKRSSSRLFKNSIYEQFARIGKAVASPRRLELLDLLIQGERTVEALAYQAKMSVANASQHLQVLRGARLVDAEKQGQYVVYRLQGPDVSAFVSTLETLAESNLDEIERISRDFFQSRDGLEPVDRETLRRRVVSGEVTVIDVRPPEEYRAGHIPGSLCVPLDDLEDHLDEIPQGREVVAYCRGPYCVLALEAAERLRAKGYRVHRLEDGVNEWRRLGFPVEKGA